MLKRQTAKVSAPALFPTWFAMRLLASYLTLPSLFSPIFQPVMLTPGISESEHRDRELTQSTLQLVPSTWKEAGRIWLGREDCFIYFVFICLFLEEFELDYFCGF